MVISDWTTDEYNVFNISWILLETCCFLRAMQGHSGRQKQLFLHCKIT